MATLVASVPMIFGGWLKWMWLFAPAFVCALSCLQFGSGPFSAIIPDIVPSFQFGAASGYMGLMDMLGTTFGAAVMGLIANALQQRFGSYYVPIVVILCVALVLGAAITALTVREKPFVMKPADVMIYRGWRERILSVWVDFRAPFRSRDFFWVFWTRFIMLAGIASVRNFLQYWFEDVVPQPYILFGALTLPDAKAATSMFLLPLLIGATISALLAGMLSDFFGRKTMVYLAGGIQALTSIGMIVFPVMNACVVLGFFFGLGYGAYQSVDFALAADCLPDAKSNAKDLGVWGISATLAGIWAPLVAGFVLDTFKAIGISKFQSPRLGYTVLFSFATVLFVVSTVLVTRIKGVRKPAVEIPLEDITMTTTSNNQELVVVNVSSTDLEESKNE